MKRIAAIILAGLIGLLSGCEHIFLKDRKDAAPESEPEPQAIEPVCSNTVPEGWFDVSGMWLMKGPSGFDGDFLLLKQCGTEIQGTEYYRNWGGYITNGVTGYVTDQNQIEFEIGWAYSDINDVYVCKAMQNHMKGKEFTKNYTFQIELVRWSSRTDLVSARDANGNALVAWVELVEEHTEGKYRHITWKIHNFRAGENYLQVVYFDSGQDPCDGMVNAGGIVEAGVYEATYGDGKALWDESTDSYYDYDSVTITTRARNQRGAVGIRIFGTDGSISCDKL